MTNIYESVFSVFELGESLTAPVVFSDLSSPFRRHPNLSTFPVRPGPFQLKMPC
jgi:hypothetical protein